MIVHETDTYDPFHPPRALCGADPIERSPLQRAPHPVNLRASAIASFLLFMAPFSVAQEVWAQPSDTTNKPSADPATPRASDVSAPTSGAREEPSQARSALAVRISLKGTELQEAAILKALANEFSMPVVRGEGDEGLRIEVDALTLRASYRDPQGQVIQRAVNLPQGRAKQLETIALLSGNLARDEAGELLAELRADVDEEAILPSDEEQEAAEDEQESSADGAAGPSPSEEEVPEAPDPAPEASPEEAEVLKSEETTEGIASKRPELPVAEISFALWGDVTWPKGLGQKKTHVHFGAVHSEIGTLEGFAANLIALHNRGRGKEFAGEGVQMSLIWAGTEGYFRGFHGAGIVATGQGGIEGVQGGGILAFQKNETLGAQLAGIATLSMSHIEGGQGGGVFAGTWGDIDGVQGAGTLAITTGDLTGVQLTSGVSVVGGTMDGFQLGGLTFAQELDGFQLGMTNVAYKKMDGFQLAMANYAGDVDGAQIGIVNIGGKVDGAQVGLLNIAHDVDGVAFAPVNIIPGIRNQVVAYGSWAPLSQQQATPVGPMAHIGFKFMPDPFYTMLSFGLAAEAEHCPGDLLPGDAQCVDNGVVYAPGFAVGLRGRITGGLFAEVDLQYQYEKAFDSSLAHRHAVLGRAALGYELSENFGVFVGGGPRMDVRVGADGTAALVPEWNPHVFAGVQVF